MTNASLHLPLAIRIAHTAGKRDDIVVLEHVAVQRINGGIVDIWFEHPFTQIVEHDDLGHAAQPAKGLLVQLSHV